MVRTNGGSPPQRVLIEHEDLERRHALMEQFLARGFDAMSCGGPRVLPDAMCSLVVDGRCPLVAVADVILYDLDLDDGAEKAVYDAIRATYPMLPVVLELPWATTSRHREDLVGAIVIPPFDTDHLVQVVDDALNRVA